MAAFRRFGGIAVALGSLTVSSCASLPAPSASDVLPSMSPGPTTDGGPFTSTRFGWTMEIPAGWEVRPATADWPPEHAYPRPGAAYTDNFEHPSGFPVIDVSTRRLPPGETPSDVLAALDAGTASLGCSVESEEDVTIDGQAARLQEQACAGGQETVWELIVFDGDQVYAIYWLSLTANASGAEAAFQEALATFQFPD